MKKSVVIVGFGKSGHRFFDVISNRNDIEVVAIVEPNIKKTKGLPSRIIVFRNIEYLVQSEIDAPDYFIISTVDKHHYSDIVAIRGKFPESLFIVEKPLSKKICEAISLSEIFDDEEIAINFVERFSKAVQQVKNYILDNDLIPVRATTFWGKNRLGDSRETMGVYSEISHSIDLVFYLFQIKNLDNNFIHSIKLESDFNGENTSKGDSLSINITNKDVICTFHSSFMWNQRKREIILFMKSPQNDCYMITFNLDNPKWDFDNYCISQFKNNRWVEVRNCSFEPTSIINQGNEKIDRFLTSVLHRNINNIAKYATLSDGLLVQKILHQTEFDGDYDGKTRFYN